MAEAFIRVMTYNIHGGLDRLNRPSLAQITATIRAIRPDLAGLQEVERGFRARAGFADQAALLAEMLGRECRFAAAIDARPGTDRGKFGNAALSAWPIGSSWKLRFPGGREPRSLLGITAETPVGRLNFLVCHLGLDPGERARQVRAILAKACCLRGPLVLVGDFNAPPAAPELAPLFDRWREAQSERGVDLPTFIPSGARIDYIFYSPHFRARRASVIPSPASDHHPLVADLVVH